MNCLELFDMKFKEFLLTLSEKAVVISTQLLIGVFIAVLKRSVHSERMNSIPGRALLEWGRVVLVWHHWCIKSEWGFF